MKKEINGWIYEGGTTLFERFPSNFNQMEGVYKATLIIEMPEKKIEITESEFMEMAKDFMIHAEMKNGPMLGSYKEPVGKWKQKLFDER